MSYELQRGQNGELLVYPLELPMYHGNTADLARQAQVSLTSCLRHFAILDAITDEPLVDPSPQERNGVYEQHFWQGAQQLSATLMALVSLADLYGIDIMQEIYDAPWNE